MLGQNNTWFADSLVFDLHSKIRTNINLLVKSLIVNLHAHYFVGFEVVFECRNFKDSVINEVAYYFITNGVLKNLNIILLYVIGVAGTTG